MKPAGRLRQKRAEGVRHSMPLYVGEARAKRSALSVHRVRFLVHYSMFVRWQRSRSQALIPWRCAKTERTRLKAILVESVRVDGKPRQKHIAFLGSIASDDAIDGTAAKRFWRDVTAKLKHLGNRIGPEEYERIVAAIAAKVGGRPTEAELEQFEREREQRMQSLRTSLAPYRRAPRPPRRRRPLRDRVEEAASKYTELLSKLDQETMDAAFRLKPASRSR
jgi:hypothetical protein